LKRLSFNRFHYIISKRSFQDQKRLICQISVRLLVDKTDVDHNDYIPLKRVVVDFYLLIRYDKSVA